MPRAVYDAQAAYNLLCGLGENAAVNLSTAEARIRRHYDALSAGRWPALALQVIHAPVFHSHAFSIAVELERTVDISAVEDALSGEHVDLVLEDTDSPSNLAATGQNDVMVRLRPEITGRNPTQVTRLWLWTTSDNLRLNAQNAVECALICAGSARRGLCSNTIPNWNFVEAVEPNCFVSTVFFFRGRSSARCLCQNAKHGTPIRNGRV